MSALRVLAGMIAHAIARSAAEERARRGEERTRAMLESLPGFVVMVNDQGEILRLSEKSGPEGLPRELVNATRGVNLLACWRTEPNAGAVAQQIEELVSGAMDSMVAEYRYETVAGPRWLEVRGERLRSSEPGAVISHVDITGRKQIESENTQNRETLWHLNRVASLGELTASLAHEINQPLAGILSSAEAAAALLDMPRPDLKEAREAIRDIIDDDRRAGAVIQKMRSMLKRKNEGTSAVDLNAAVAGTLRLLANEARLRHVILRQSLAEGLPAAAADPTQLQQVVVNLVTNAIEAVEGMPDGRRQVTVETRLDVGSNAPVLEVRDSGTGIPASLLKAVFDPFVTTKTKGLGLGLSICRSIMESSGGKVLAENVPDGGAVFQAIFRSVPASQDTARAASAWRLKEEL